MSELFIELFKLLEQIPTNVAIGALAIVLTYIIRRQDKINKKNEDSLCEVDEKLRKGTSNFTMIDDHFLRVHQHFTQIHEENVYLTKMVLKDIIYNESIDPHERQDAYDEYVRIGGNGQVRLYYETILEPLVREHTITRRGR